MQGDKEIIAFLNEQLTAELTAISQYFSTRSCKRTAAG